MFAEGSYHIKLFKKGQIWWCTDFVADDKKTEWENNLLVGSRPVILASSMVINGTIQAIPLSSCKQPYSDIKDEPGLHIRIKKRIISRVLVNVTKPINVASLVKMMGEANDNVMTHIDRMLAIYYGLADEETVTKYRNLYFKEDLPIGFDGSKPNSKPVDFGLSITNNKPKSNINKGTTNNSRVISFLKKLPRSELIDIMNGRVYDLAERYNVCNKTIYRYRHIIEDNNLVKA